MTTPDQNNPYQEPTSAELTFAEAVRAIAERTAFRTEAERSAVYAACNRQAAREGAEVLEYLTKGTESDKAPDQEPQE